MKDRAVLLSTLTLIVTVTLFVWLTWNRWGTVGIHPALGALVLGAAFIAVAASGLLLLYRRRLARARRRRAPSVRRTTRAVETAPATEPPQEAEKTKVAAVEMK